MLTVALSCFIRPIQPVEGTMVFCSIRVRIAWAIIGISAGIMAGAVFGFRYHNISATTLAFISSIFATLLMLFHIWYHKGKLSYWSKAKFNFVGYSCKLFYDTKNVTKR